MPPDKLLWIELRGIGRQEIDMEPRVLVEKASDTLGPVGQPRSQRRTMWPGT